MTAYSETTKQWRAKAKLERMRREKAHNFTFTHKICKNPPYLNYQELHQWLLELPALQWAWNSKDLEEQNEGNLEKKEKECKGNKIQHKCQGLLWKTTPRLKDISYLCLGDVNLRWIIDY